MLTRPVWCGARQATLPLPGPDRSRIPIWTWCPTRNRSTACTVPSCPDTSRTTAWTCSSGSRAASPEGRRAYPAGSGTASSPRPALASRPDAIRCLIRCRPALTHRALQAQLSDPSQLLRREWPGHVVDDASLTWRRGGRGRPAAGSVAGGGVPGVPAQREQFAVGGGELGLGFG